MFECYMHDLFGVSRRFVIIYSSNLSMEQFEARFPGVEDPHVRHRKFTDWIAANRPDWRLAESISNPYPFDPAAAGDTSFADFFVFHKADWAPRTGSGA